MNIKSIINNGFLKKVFSVFMTKGILFLVSIGASVLSARIMGPEGRGMFAAAAAVGGIGSQFMNLGMHGASKYALIKKNARLEEIVGNALMLSVAAAGVALVMYLVLENVPGLVQIQGVLLALACLYVPLSLYSMLQQNLLVGVDLIRQYNAVELLNGVLYPAFLAILALVGIVCPETAFSATILACVISIGTGWILLRKKINRTVRPSWTLFKDCIPFGLKSYVACLCSYLVIRSDILMVNYMLGNEQTGLYTVAVSLSDVISMLPAAAGMLLFPEAMSIDSDKKRSDFMKHTLMVMAAVMGALTLLAALLSKFAFALLYGADYAPSAVVFIILMPGIFFMALQSVLSNYFAAKNMWTGNIITPLAGFLLNLTINAMLIPTMGINGAAIASVLAYTGMFLIMFARFLWDNHKIEGREKG